MVEFTKVISEAHQMCGKYGRNPLNDICKDCPAHVEIGDYGEQDCALHTSINSAIFGYLNTDESEAAAKKFEKIVMDWSERNRRLATNDR